MSKLKIIDTQSTANILAEKNFLSKMNNKFIVNMKCSFQDFSFLYLVMDLLTGGDLRYHLDESNISNLFFEEYQIKFLISNLILATEYIHSKKIIHCDIKPENIIFDRKGYAHITDFGIARPSYEISQNEFNGTPGYMAPELLFCEKYSFPVDFYAIGIVTHELMFKVRPYKTTTIEELRDEIFEISVKINKKDLILNNFSIEMGDFVDQLLKKKECKRLGYINGIKDLKNHKWFKEFDWGLIERQAFPSPFLPIINKYGKEDIYDKEYCEEKNPIGMETHLRYQEILNDQNYLHIFTNYTCICYPEDKPIYFRNDDNCLNYCIHPKEHEKSRNINFLDNYTNLPFFIKMQKKAIISMRDTVQNLSNNKTCFNEIKVNSCKHSKSSSRITFIEFPQQNNEKIKSRNNKNERDNLIQKMNKIKLPKIFKINKKYKNLIKIKNLNFIPIRDNFTKEDTPKNKLIKSISQKSIHPLRSNML